MTTPSTDTPKPAERAPATYITARFADGLTREEQKPYKRVLNLFYGSDDKRGLPILLNHDEKTMGLVNATQGKLDLFHLDEKGGLIAEGDKPAQPYLTIGLKRFLDGHDAKALEVGQGAITGPNADKLKAAFQQVLDAKPVKPAADAAGPSA